MKSFKILAILLLTTGLLFSMSSCVVLVKDRQEHDNGHHWGWYKNPENPHHPGHKNYDNDKNNGDGHGKKEKPDKKPGKNKHRG